MIKKIVLSFVLIGFARHALAEPQALYSVNAPDEVIEVVSHNYDKLPPIVDCLLLDDALQRANCLDPNLLPPRIAKRAIVAPGDAARKVCMMGLQVAEEQIYLPKNKSSANDYVFYDPPNLKRLQYLQFAHIARVPDVPASETLQVRLGSNQPLTPVYAMDFAGSRESFVWHLAVPVVLSENLKAIFVKRPDDERPPYRWFQDVVANTRHPYISYSLGIVKNRKPISMSNKLPMLYDASNTALFKDAQVKSEIVVLDEVAYLRSLAKMKQKAPDVALFAFADDGNLDVLCWSKLVRD